MLHSCRLYPASLFRLGDKKIFRQSSSMYMVVVVCGENAVPEEVSYGTNIN